MDDVAAPYIGLMVTAIVRCCEVNKLLMSQHDAAEVAVGLCAANAMKLSGVSKLFEAVLLPLLAAEARGVQAPASVDGLRATLADRGPLHEVFVTNESLRVAIECSEAHCKSDAGDHRQSMFFD